MPDLSISLSRNFTLRELLRSASAERNEELKSKQENPPPEVVDNLTYLVKAALQPVREGIGHPIRITSGYRCPEVNELVGGSKTSQHCLGEAGDCELSRTYLTDTSAAGLRSEIETRVREATGDSLRTDVTENFYLFAYVCLHLNDLDIDQVIHEYGDGFGRPSWVHISASKRQNKRQILFVGRYTNGKYLKPSAEEALSYGTRRQESFG